MRASCSAQHLPQHTVDAPWQLGGLSKDRHLSKLLRLPEPIIEIVDYINTMTLVDLPHFFCGHLCDTNGHRMLLSLTIDCNRLACFCLQTQQQPLPAAKPGMSFVHLRYQVNKGC